MAHEELLFVFQPLEPYRDILIAELLDLGYEAFEEVDEGLKAYIAKDQFDVVQVRSLYVLNDSNLKVEFTHAPLPEKNWNAEWEADYEPIEIAKKVRVRASFHQKSEAFAYDILIDPRMSFGTGHHATTRLMLTNAYSKELTGLNVLDMGCGTAVIAILAKMKNAATVAAIDIDDNCVRNSIENVELNHVNIDVQKGGAERLSGQCFHVIFANINRNVLLEDMPMYSEALEDGGILVMSGFYEADLDALTERATTLGMEFVSKAQEAEWCSLEFKKK